MGIKTETKERIHKSWDDVPVSATCDVCGIDLVPTKKAQDGMHVDLYNFYQITTYHYDWGNDSVDSYEYFIACCSHCALRFMSKYLTKNFKQYSTKKIEIERLDRLDQAISNQSKY